MITRIRVQIMKCCKRTDGIETTEGSKMQKQTHCKLTDVKEEKSSNRTTLTYMYVRCLDKQPLWYGTALCVQYSPDASIKAQKVPKKSMCPIQPHMSNIALHVQYWPYRSNTALCVQYSPDVSITAQKVPKNVCVQNSPMCSIQPHVSNTDPIGQIQLCVSNTAPMCPIQPNRSKNIWCVQYIPMCAIEPHASNTAPIG